MPSTEHRALANELALGLIVLQPLVGGAIVFSRLDLWTTLAHAASMALLFVCLADAACQVLPQPRRASRSRAMLAPVAGTTG